MITGTNKQRRIIADLNDIINSFESRLIAKEAAFEVTKNQQLGLEIDRAKKVRVLVDVLNDQIHAINLKTITLDGEELSLINELRKQLRD